MADAERRTGRKAPTIAIVGGGFAGIGLAIALKRAGIDSFTIYERGPDVGGVWRDNTYPGCACDIPSRFYSYSFEPDWNWTAPYGNQDEILDYIKHCVAKYDLAAQVPLRHQRDARRVRRRRQAMAARNAVGRDHRRRRLRLRRRGLQQPGDPRESRPRPLRRAAIPFRLVEPRRRARGQVGRRDRHRRQRNSVRARHRAQGGAPHLVPAHPAIRAAAHRARYAAASRARRWRAGCSGCACSSPSRRAQGGAHRIG